MLCDDLTEGECLKRNLFGDKAKNLQDLDEIKPGDIGLLLNVCSWTKPTLSLSVPSFRNPLYRGQCYMEISVSLVSIDCIGVGKR